MPQVDKRVLLGLSISACILGTAGLFPFLFLNEWYTAPSGGEGLPSKSYGLVFVEGSVARGWTDIVKETCGVSSDLREALDNNTCGPAEGGGEGGDGETGKESESFLERMIQLERRLGEREGEEPSKEEEEKEKEEKQKETEGNEEKDPEEPRDPAESLSSDFEEEECQEEYATHMDTRCKEYKGIWSNNLVLLVCTGSLAFLGLGFSIYGMATERWKIVGVRECVSGWEGGGVLDHCTSTDFVSRLCLQIVWVGASVLIVLVLVFWMLQTGGAFGKIAGTSDKYPTPSLGWNFFVSLSVAALVGLLGAPLLILQVRGGGLEVEVEASFAPCSCLCEKPAGPTALKGIFDDPAADGLETVEGEGNDRETLLQEEALAAEVGTIDDAQTAAAVEEEVQKRVKALTASQIDKGMSKSEYEGGSPEGGDGDRTGGKGGGWEKDDFGMGMPACE
uniref:Transmembrane protein n=1 Tax=Chromera velia CCMP2878 TaxID=1169474 RepID=A0A0K6S978_9ALVE|eukprot:Cvel_7011.t2-p1 / transcript=Cvel_7011.t2 / gene=Cvel_7011 / organism=Chromera_velia_CCMP2878 / gene_product=hypothetical protein / transcript_product=hypothetical protein / location=Cvel_scaffold357:24714-26998(+) / protein_length=449 / sequence_SO=supercontig / SO=protein_coding / is_pseudo=false